MSPSVDDVLRTTAGFRRLTAEDRQHVARVARLQHYPKGETIFREGDPSESFFSIVAGRVKIVKAAPSGKDLILEVFGHGDPFGAVAVYEGRPFPASAVAIEDTTCILIPRREFFALLEQHPTLVRGLLLGLTQRLIELTNRLAEIAGGRIESRFARLFLKLGQDLGQTKDGAVFVPLALSRQELADMTGTTIETCIRIMSRWSKEEVVATEKDGFAIRDLPTLRALAAA